MKGETSDNGFKVADLQDNMEEALKNITTFIRTQMDGRTARRIAWEKMRQEQEKDAAAEVSSPSIMRTSLGTALPVIPPIGRHGTLVEA